LRDKKMCAALFRRDAAPLTAWQIVVWWELRRMPYSLIVGATGIVTCTVMVIVSMITDRLIGVPIGMPDPPVFALLGIFVYGIMANMLYTAGWIVELVLAGAWDIRPRNFARVAFGLGLLGSVCLTLMPALFTLVVAAVQVSAVKLGVQGIVGAVGE